MSESQPMKFTIKLVLTFLLFASAAVASPKAMRTADLMQVCAQKDGAVACLAYIKGVADTFNQDEYDKFQMQMVPESATPERLLKALLDYTDKHLDRLLTESATRAIQNAIVEENLKPDAWK